MGGALEKEGDGIRSKDSSSAAKCAFPGSGVSGLPLEKQLGQLPGRWASPGPPLPAAAAQLLSAETCFWNKNWVSPLSGICPARETPDSGLHVLI